MDFWRVSPWRQGSATHVYRSSCWIGSTVRGGAFPPSLLCSVEADREAAKNEEMGKEVEIWEEIHGAECFFNGSQTILNIKNILCCSLKGSA